MAVLTVSRVRPSCIALSLCSHRRPLSDLLLVPAPPRSSLCVGSWGADAELAELDAIRRQRRLLQWLRGCICIVPLCSTRN